MYEGERSSLPRDASLTGSALSRILLFIMSLCTSCELKHKSEVFISQSVEVSKCFFPKSFNGKPAARSFHNWKHRCSRSLGVWIIAISFLIWWLSGIEIGFKHTLKEISILHYISLSLFLCFFFFYRFACFCEFWESERMSRCQVWLLFRLQVREATLFPNVRFPSCIQHTSSQYVTDFHMKSPKRCLSYSSEHYNKLFKSISCLADSVQTKQCLLVN